MQRIFHGGGLSSGGGLLSGGALRSGGAFTVGSGLASGGRLGRSGRRPAGHPSRAAPQGLGHKTYHDLIHMPHHKWEQVREGARQMLGHRPSPMWGKMHLQNPPGGMRTLTDIARTSTPTDAARSVELEGVRGGDFTHGVHHVLTQVANQR